MEKTADLQLNQANNSISKWLLVVVFIAPAIFAWWALKANWFNLAVTNQGVLLQPAISLNNQQLPEQLQNKWIISYFVDENCRQCDNAVYLLNQVRAALGKEQARSEIALISTESLSKQTELTQIKLNSTGLAQLVVGHFYIIDPLGQIILQYSLEQTPSSVTTELEQDKILGKAILADLRKLLKLSKIG
ncbi:hypothetical protein [Catenovulum agarivorans]|uniref:hypothetical protein n=1 Tax=Catenovulum agarivorans TaxID=1172192 RepID=UPI0002EE8308|nr:hypothetical protein [Catenovulum agarivorans]